MCVGEYNPRAMADEIIRLTRAQVREVDRIAIEEYGVPGIVLMENAARAVAEAAMGLMADFRTRRVLILCGGGNNGGDGLAAARLLKNRDFDVEIAVLRIRIDTPVTRRSTGGSCARWKCLVAPRRRSWSARSATRW